MNGSCDIPIDAYHDGELSPSQREQVQQHLAHCPRCAAQLEALRGLSAALESAQAPKLSQIAAERLRRGVEELMRRRRLEQQQQMRMAWRWGAAAACVALVGSLWMSRMSRPAEAAPPWVGMAAAMDSDSAARQADSPAAQWYLASAWTQEDTGNGL